MSATGVPIGGPMVALHVWNERGIVMFSRDDEGRDFLKIVAAKDEPLAKDIDDAWWAATPRPFLLHRSPRRRS